MSTFVQRHVLLVDDRGGGFAHAFASRGGAQPTDAGPPPTLLPLRSPKGPTRKYLVSGGALLELSRVGQAAPCSWFIGESVRSDGSMLVATPVDPVLLALPLLDVDAGGGGGAPARFSPLDQWLRPPGGGVDATVLTRVDGFAAGLASVCDVRALPDAGDGAGETRLYRLSREKATAYLTAKAVRLAFGLQATADEALARARAAAGSFAVATTARASAPAGADAGAGAGAGAGSTAGADAGAGTASASLGARATAADVLAHPPSAAHNETAVALLADYVSEPWAVAVADRLRVPVDAFAPALAKARRAAGGAPRAAAGLATPAGGAGAGGGAGGAGAGGDARRGSTAPRAETEEDADIAAYVAGEAGGGEGGGDDGGLSGARARAAAWDAAARADAAGPPGGSLMNPSTFSSSRGGGGGAGGAGGAPAAAKTPAPSLALKRLASVSTKGMKPLTSFFGPKK